MPARSRHARAAAAPRSAAESAARPPPNLPIGVRTGAAKTRCGRRRVMPWAASDAGEAGRALLHECRQPFLGVIALEQLLLQLALQGQTGLERHLGPRLHRSLDAADRLGGAVGWAELLGVGVDLVEEVVALE